MDGPVHEYLVTRLSLHLMVMFFVMAAKHARSLTAYVETHAQIHDT